MTVWEKIEQLKRELEESASIQYREAIARRIDRLYEIAIRQGE